MDLFNFHFIFFNFILFCMTFPLQAVAVDQISNHVDMDSLPQFTNFVDIQPSAHSYSFNQRPRFKIPPGNLSFFRNLQATLLHYVKGGSFPEQASGPWFKRPQVMKNGKQETDQVEVDDFLSKDTKNGGTSSLKFSPWKPFAAAQPIIRVDSEITTTGTPKMTPKPTPSAPGNRMPITFNPIGISEELGGHGPATGDGLLLTPVAEIRSLVNPFGAFWENFGALRKGRVKRPSSMETGDLNEEEEKKMLLSLYDLLRSKLPLEAKPRLLPYTAGSPAPDSQRKEPFTVDTMLNRKVHRKFQTQGWK